MAKKPRSHKSTSKKAYDSELSGKLKGILKDAEHLWDVKGAECFWDDASDDVNDPKKARGESKLTVTNVPPAAILEMAKVLQHGADKYGRYNWREGHSVKTSVYINAALRHLLAYWDGETYDRESGLCHLSHVMAGLAILTDCIANKATFDDRPYSGKAADILENN